MKITKIGHCCLVIETKGVRLMTDPGSFTKDGIAGVSGIDAIIFTHEHQDHYHLESLKTILENNQDAVVIGNSAMQKLLQAERIESTLVGDGNSTEVKGVLVEGFGKNHALVYPPDMGLCENTGYMLDGAFYFPGDAFHNPGKKVDILALPVAGPWMKISEAIDFAKEINPRVAFGVHDGIMQIFFRGYPARLMEKYAAGVQYVALQDGETKEL